MGSSEISAPVYQTPQRLISEESNIHRQRFEQVRFCKHSELLQKSLATSGMPVPCQDARNIWHIARDGPFTCKAFYESFYNSFVYKNTERIQDTILLIWRACLDVNLRTLPAIFKNLYVIIALFGAFYLLNSSSFPFPL